MKGSVEVTGGKKRVKSRSTFKDRPRMKFSIHFHTHTHTHTLRPSPSEDVYPGSSGLTEIVQTHRLLKAYFGVSTDTLCPRKAFSVKIYCRSKSAVGSVGEPRFQTTWFKKPGLGAKTDGH